MVNFGQRLGDYDGGAEGPGAGAHCGGEDVREGRRPDGEPRVRLQGNFAHKKTPSPRSLLGPIPRAL